MWLSRGARSGSRFKRDQPPRLIAALALGLSPTVAGIAPMIGGAVGIGERLLPADKRETGR
jgi:hypothetical protein